MQKTACELRISDWSADVCSADLLSGGSLPLLLVLTMVASLILGMGLPTLGAYIVLAVLVAPSMVQLGVEPLAAHLFIFYFGVISAITPPVCMAARSEEHTSELQSLMRISYAVFCLKKKKLSKQLIKYTNIK